MTITIDLPPELAEALQRQVILSGRDLNALVVEAVREKVAKEHRFDEVCAPFARAVESAGMDDAEFDRFFEQARNEAWHEKQGHAS